mgnify:CR=1 FL=1
MYEPGMKIKEGDAVTAASLDDGAITLSSVEFTYPTKKEIKVVKGVDIKVPKNKTVALVGTSGCGKSTIIQLVERFYDPDVGTLKYGNQDLKDLNPVEFKQHIAIV